MFGMVATANASSFPLHFAGTMAYTDDIVEIYFTLDVDMTADRVAVWTDSWLNGLNFDPVIQLWNAADGSLIAQNDDGYWISPDTQTTRDAGLLANTLAAGEYIITVVCYGSYLWSDNFYNGFCLNAPGYSFEEAGVNGDWSLRVDEWNVGTGLEHAVPIPGTAWLLGSGLVGLVGIRRRFKKA